MNRRERRGALVRPTEAKAAGALLAAACFHRAPDGTERPIEHPAAIRALSRAFARAIMDKGRQQLVRLAPEEGHAFPSCEDAHRAAEWCHWLAVGFDGAGRGTFATLATLPEPGMPEAEHRALAWDRIRTRLRDAMAEDWAPATAGAGG